MGQCGPDMTTVRARASSELAAAMLPLLGDCVEHVLEQVGLVCDGHELWEPGEIAHELPDTLAVIGFSNVGIRGSLVLMMDAELLFASMPSRAAVSDTYGPRVARFDWLCELANRSIGRARNRLLCRGLEILISTPTALSATALELRAARGSKSELLAFSCRPRDSSTWSMGTASRVLARLDVAAEYVMTLADVDDHAQAHVDGDVFMF